MSDCDDAFALFLENINLGANQTSRIDSAVSGLTTYLSGKFGLEIDDELFLQGSYANGTAVKPRPGGEYDVDLVAISANERDSSTDALNNMAAVLRESGRYRDRVTSKDRCIRLRYADEGAIRFHVDVVPLKRDIWGLQSPVRGSEWRLTAPAEYTSWCTQQNESFIPLVKILKRWRDEQQEVRAAVKSIVLQVLIARSLELGSSMAETTLRTLVRMGQELAPYATDPPIVWNPVLATENLADRWSAYEFGRFKTQVDNAVTAATNAFEECDDEKSQLLWKELLGSAFPAPAKRQRPAALESRSISVASQQMSRLRDQSWTEVPNSIYDVALSANVFDGTGNRQLVADYASDSTVLKDDWRIRFDAKTRGPDDVQIWWQVVNTGPEVERLNSFRGGFFQAKMIDGAKSADSKVNWERTEYTGRHWIECFLVKSRQVVARSGRFFVNIRNSKDRT